LPHANTQLAIGYYEALNRRDFGFYDATFTDDVTLAAPGGVSVHGKPAVAAFDQIWTRAFSDFTIVGGFHVADDERIVCHNRATGTHDGILVMPDGSEVPPTGRRLDAPYFASFDVRDGRLSSQLVYFDRMLLAEELGLLPLHA
jgi:ketosteroid isomerase-like protein